MGISRGEKYIHLDLYLTIEEDLKTLSRYIGFHEENDNVFSIELARILLIASSEIDVVLKLLCKKLDPEGSFSSINDYRDEIKEKMNTFSTEKIYSSRYGLELTPFLNWSTGDTNPDWWKAYNHVKHNRDTCYMEANLKNTLNSVAGLLIVLNYYYLVEISGESDVSKLKDILHDLGNKGYKTNVFSFSENYYYSSLVV